MRTNQYYCCVFLYHERATFDCSSPYFSYWEPPVADWLILPKVVLSSTNLFIGVYITFIGVYSMSRVRIRMIPPYHPWAKFCIATFKMAAMFNSSQRQHRNVGGKLYVFVDYTSNGEHRMTLVMSYHTSILHITAFIFKMAATITQFLSQFRPSIT